MSIRAMFVGNAPARAVAAADKKPAVELPQPDEQALTRDRLEAAPPQPAAREKPKTPADSAGPRD